MFLLVNNLFGEDLFGDLRRLGSFDDVRYFTENRARGGSAYLINMQATNIVQWLIFTPIRMLYFKFSPLPWYWRGFSDISAFFMNSVLIIATYITVFKSIKIKNETRNLLLVMLVLLLTIALMFAWGVSNAGTAIRHREKFISIFIITLALGLDQIKGRRVINNEGSLCEMLRKRTIMRLQQVLTLHKRIHRNLISKIEVYIWKNVKR